MTLVYRGMLFPFNVRTSKNNFSNWMFFWVGESMRSAEGSGIFASQFFQKLGRRWRKGWVPPIREAPIQIFQPWHFIQPTIDGLGLE